MERLTKKDARYVEGDKRFLSPYCIVECGLQAEIDRLTKLGQLEDIMEKFEISSVQGLESILGECVFRELPHLEKPKNYEILKLKTMLEEANIPFEFTDNLFKKRDEPSYQILIKKHDRKLCDCIYHFGSYGYYQGLLEIMGGLTKEEQEDTSVLGYMTAEQVFKRFKYCYEHNTSTYHKEEDNAN